MPISGTVIDIYLDLRDTSRNTAWVLTTDSIWRTRNLRSNRPSWVEKTAIAVFFPSAPGTIIPKRLVGSPASNSLYCLIYVETGAGTGSYEQYVVSTTDDGGSWSPISTGFGSDYGALWTFPVDPPDNPPNMDGWTSVYDLAVWDNTEGHDGLGSVRVSGSASVILIQLNHNIGAYGGTFSAWFKWHLNSGTPAGTFFSLRANYTDSTTSYDTYSNPTQDTWHYLTFTFNVKQTTNFEIQLFITSGTGTLWVDDIQINSPGVEFNPPAYAVISAGWTLADLSSAIGVGRHDPLKVYLGSASKIFRSTDGAATFSEYIASLGAYDIVCPHQGNAADNNILFIGGDGKIYFSSGATPGAAIMGTAENPVTNQHGRLAMRWSDSSKIYALIATAADTFKIIRTADTGSNWSDGATDLTEAKSIQVYQFGPSAIATQRLALLASLDAGLTYDILRSLDGGENLSSGIGNYGTFDSPVAIAIG